METFVEMEDRYEERETNAGETIGSLLSGKMAELQKIKEKVGKAKDDAMQSWLDSRPLIDELEKMQSELGSIKNQADIYSTTISELESQIENLGTSIRSKKEEELKIRSMINSMNQAIDRTREEMEQIKIERDEKNRARLQLKQVLRVKKQSLRALELTLRAIQLESEAFSASLAEARSYISCAQTDDTVVKLRQQEYQEMIKKAHEETSLAEWRIAVSTEQKNAAAESRKSCIRRLENLHSKGRTRQRMTRSQGISDQTTEPAAENGESDVKAEGRANNGHNSFKRPWAKSFTQQNQKKPQEQSKRPKSPNNRNNHLSKKKRRSLFSRIRIFLVQNLRRCVH